MRTELKEPPAKIEPNPQEPPPWARFWERVEYEGKQNWRKFWEAPIAFLVVIAVSFYLARLFVWNVIVPIKDEQLRSKEATIQQKEATIQQLQTALSLSGINSLPLKKRTLTLADQLEKFVSNYPKDQIQSAVMQMDFGERFGFRIGKIIAELDEQGQHVDQLDQNSSLWNGLRSIPIQVDAIQQLANHLRKLAGNLKD